jgi:energy-coupling factor transporter ATP-binding protein EcfA2
LPENPFATRHVRPGKVPYFLRESECAEDLLEQLQRNEGWGEIIGPHGSGKSTLLETLIPLLERQGKRVVRFSIHDRQRKLPACRAELSKWNRQTQVIVDGFEQLSWWNRRSLSRHCRRHHVGLMVTAHRPMGLPRLYQRDPDRETFLRVVEFLLKRPVEAPNLQEVCEPFNRREGDVRESLFDLYDLYQQRRS